MRILVAFSTMFAWLAPKSPAACANDRLGWRSLCGAGCGIGVSPATKFAASIPSAPTIWISFARKHDLQLNWTAAGMDSLLNKNTIKNAMHFCRRAASRSSGFGTPICGVITRACRTRSSKSSKPGHHIRCLSTPGRLQRARVSENLILYPTGFCWMRR